MQYFTVGLLIPVMEGEAAPNDWDWQALIDTSAPVVVTHSHPMHDHDLPVVCQNALQDYLQENDE